MRLLVWFSTFIYRIRYLPLKTLLYSIFSLAIYYLLPNTRPWNIDNVFDPFKETIDSELS